MDLSDPVAAAIRCAEALESAGIPYALHGGLLLPAYGVARETRDADLAVAEASAASVERALRAAGILATPAFADLVLGGVTVDRFALLPRGGETGLNTLDIIRPRSLDYRARAVARSLRAPLEGHPLNALGPEDFVLFKVLSTRDRDLRDAVSVLRRTGAAMDAILLRKEVEFLAGDIRDFDVRSRFAELLRLYGDPTERRLSEGESGEVRELTPAQWRRLGRSVVPRAHRRRRPRRQRAPRRRRA